MSACSGSWIAHGCGSGDKHSSDSKGRLIISAENSKYTLRRLWLTEDEERGYYQGFSNEGLWPLCHMTKVAPQFRIDDWDHYELVNRRFASAVLEEASTNDPIVLVQDYHLALVPNLVRKYLPKAQILTFWHIPWPSPDWLSLCPWHEQILEGLLGSTTLGFQTEQHRRNFLQAASRLDQYKTNDIDSTVINEKHTSHIKHYPISIPWPEPDMDRFNSSSECKKKIFKELALNSDHLLMLGIDRLDYTKGIVERLMSFELLLESHPDYIGRLSLVQIGAPTRCSVEAYQDYEMRVCALVQRINDQFSGPMYVPVHLRLRNHDQLEVEELYRACDVCLVTSLHDGMNLVAKEFVAAREDNRGTLILSKFTGAAFELHDAVIVDPHDTEQTTHAMVKALEMTCEEIEQRMRNMRNVVRKNNIYKWAGRMLLDGAQVCSTKTINSSC